MVKLSHRLIDFSYAIRDIAAVADKVRASGKKVYNLNIGDPVQVDFTTPEYICKAMAEAAYSNKNYYVNSLGIPELREAIVNLEKEKNCISMDPDQVLVTQGVSEGIMFLSAAFLDSGDEFLMPSPVYPPYLNFCKFFDGVPVEYKLNEEDDWKPDIDDLRKKITKKTKAILIISPNNPTGVVFSNKNIEDIINLAGEHDLPIISDEIYDQIIYDKKYECPASKTNDVPIIGLNGFSKAHLATGWRLGYMYFHDPENKLKDIKEGVEKLARTRLCANSVSQFAALEALTNPHDYTVKMVEKLKERRDIAHKRINEIDGFTCVKPQGAFYLFPKIDFTVVKKWKTDKEFVLDLLKNTGVCLVHGSGFGNYGKDHVRIVYLGPPDFLNEVFDIIEDYVGH